MDISTKEYTVAQFRRNIREALNLAYKGNKVTIRRYDEIYSLAYEENTTTYFKPAAGKANGGKPGDALLKQETSPPDKEVIEKGARLLENLERLEDLERL